MMRALLLAIMAWLPMVALGSMLNPSPDLLATEDVPPEKNRTVVLKAGTAIQIETSQTADFDFVTVGQTLDFRVMYPIKVDGAVVVQAGARATGLVVSKKKNKSWGRPGMIVLRPSTVTAIDGQQITVTGDELLFIGRARTGAAIALPIVLGILTLGIGWVIGFAIKGRKPEVTYGQKMNVMVGVEAEIEVE